MREYKKTYKPLILWCFAITIIPIVEVIVIENRIICSAKALNILISAEILLALDLLFYMMYRGEYAYWVQGGPSFEEAKEAGSKARKEYLLAHLKVFLKATVICLIYMVYSYVARLSIWMDVNVMTVIIVIAAFFTVPIKFSNYVDKTERKEDIHG